MHVRTAAAPTVTSEPSNQSEPLKLLAAPTVQWRSAMIELKPSLSAPGTLTWRLTYKSPEGRDQGIRDRDDEGLGRLYAFVTVKPSAAALKALKRARKKGHGLSVNARLTFRAVLG